jgi:RNase P subunit RPR2
MINKIYKTTQENDKIETITLDFIYEDTVYHSTEYMAETYIAKRIADRSNMPKGFKVYTCTDCKEINVKKNNDKIRVGFCDNCEHPLWNDETYTDI